MNHQSTELKDPPNFYVIIYIILCSNVSLTSDSIVTCNKILTPVMLIIILYMILYKLGN